MLGGWEGSERYSRAAKHKIASMQNSVSMTFKSTELDPLAEDDLDAPGMFLKSWEVPDEEVLRTKTLLVSRTFMDVQRDDLPEVPAGHVDLVPGELVPDDGLDEMLAVKKMAKEKQQNWNRDRSELLGSDHKQTRAALRAKLEPGYYISYSGKKATKVLHRIGQCFMLPGVDEMSYEYAGMTLNRTRRSANGVPSRRISRRIRVHPVPTPPRQVKRRSDSRSSVEPSSSEFR